ncbi:MAG: hypothetical protein GTO18_04735 [Anaerolineales bacterium]|nr:hypothetical protein [Anaerolineales bacterium]
MSSTNDRPYVPPLETTPNWVAGVRRRMPFYVLTAVLLAILAGVLTFTFLERVQSVAVPTTQAVVALQDIRPGSVVKESMIEVRDVPDAQLPDDAVKKLSDVVDRAAVLPIVSGEVLVHSRVSGGAGGGLSARLPDGRWAMVLPGNWFVSPVPELHVSDRIDLVAYQAGDPIGEAGVIVTAVEIINFAGSPDSSGNLTLAVTLDEAVAVLYAHVNGFHLLPLLRPQGG